jgi:phage-related protein
MQLFGKSAQELNPLIAQGSEGFADLSQKAHDMGLVMDEETLTSLGNLDDSMKLWEGTIQGLSNTLAANLAPEFTNIINSVSESASAFGNFISSIGTSDGSFETNLENLKTSVLNFFQVFSESETTMKILGWGLILAGAIIALAPVISAAVSGLIALVTAGVALWPVSVGLALAGGLLLFWPQISEFFTNIWNGLSEFFGNLWANITGFLEQHWQDLLLWIFAWPEALIKTLIDFWPQISAWLSGIWDKIKAWGSDTWNGIVKWFINLKDNMVNKAKDMITATVDWFKKLPGDIWNAIVGAVSKIAEWGSNLVSKGEQAATDLWNAVVNGIKNLPNELLKIGGNLVQGLWNGINGMINWIKEKIKGFADTVTGWIKGFFGIQSPSKLFRDQIGKNLALGLGDGFTNEMGTISEEMVNAVPTEFDMPSVNADSPIYGADALQNASYQNGLSAASALSSSNEGLISALQQALTGMAFEIDGDKMGQMVISKVERVVFA